MIILRLSLGVVFTLLGVAGVFLPVLQGWMFFLLAAVVFFPESRFADKVLEKAEPKLPKLVGWLRRIGVGTRRVSRGRLLQ